jgi:hypothetical protein
MSRLRRRPSGPDGWCCLEVRGRLLGYERHDILAQRALIVVQREHVVGLLGDELLGDVALAGHRIDGYDHPLDRQHVEQLRDGVDLVGIVRDLHLAQHEALAGCEGRNHVDQRRRVLLAPGPPRRLAIDGNQPLRRSGLCRDPGDEAALELLGSEHCKDIAEMTVRRRAILERVDAAQHLELLEAQRGEIDEGFRPGQHRKQADKQALVERLYHLALLARMLQTVGIVQKTAVTSSAAQSVVVTPMASPGQRIERRHKPSTLISCHVLLHPNAVA